MDYCLCLGHTVRHWGFRDGWVVKNPPEIKETLVRCLGWEEPWRRDKLPTPVSLDFPGCWHGKESACNVGDLVLIPGMGRSARGEHGNPLQCSCLEDPHGQRSLAGYSPWGCRVGHNWATKHSTACFLTSPSKLLNKFLLMVMWLFVVGERHRLRIEFDATNSYERFAMCNV